MQTRNTVQRQIVFDTVQKMHNHPTAEAVYDVVVRKHPSISKATVYRNLNQLAVQGQIQRVPIPNNADRFDYRCDSHYHARCKHCGKVIDIVMPYLGDLTQQVENAGDIHLENYDILFEGLCDECSKKS